MGASDAKDFRHTRLVQKKLEFNCEKVPRDALWLTYHNLSQ